MFQYSKEFILNSVEGKVKKVEGIRPDLTKEDKIVIERVGEFFPSYMSKVEMTEGHKGEYATLTITPGTLEAGEYNIRINVKMPHKYLGEYAHPNYAAFGKPIMIGFSIKEGDNAVKKIYEQMYEALFAADEFVAIEEQSSAVKLTAKDFYMVFDGVEFAKYDECGDGCKPEAGYKDLGESIFTITENVEPFATGQWILENLRLPSTQNLRFGTVNDEMPVPSMVYTQFSFAYTSPRPGFGGLSGVGQRVEAVTNHVFYVPANEAEAFKAALEGATVENEIPDTAKENVQNPSAGVVEE
jgi:hypothetical protein